MRAGHLQYFWSYEFIRWIVYGLAGGIVGVLVFLGISAGIVSRRTRRVGKRGALTIEELDVMSKEKGG